EWGSTVSLNYFQCSNRTICLSSRSLCDDFPQCPEGDDEAFCEDRRDICSEYKIHDRTPSDEALCLFGDYQAETKPFTLKNSPVYPPRKAAEINRIHEQSTELHFAKNTRHFETNDFLLAWHCHRGLYAQLWLSPTSLSYQCFCPPSYYGDRCQYQSERVSLTLGVFAADSRMLYEIAVSLFDDDNDRQEIYATEQVLYLPTQKCSMKYNIYLLYPTRPKNMSKNYSIRIDVFKKISLEYLASWSIKIPFLFMPVNRLAIMLRMPAYRMRNVHNCASSCQNGECSKYMNTEEFFCQCQTGWSGARCHIRTDCSN
ncbi:unnamed protein product, partial [Adineta ricciae]